MDDSELLPGVRAIEHTADLAIEVTATSLPQLFERAAAGMIALVEGDSYRPAESSPFVGGGANRPAASTPTEEQRFAFEAEDTATLLVSWLREILYQHQVRGFRYRRVVFDALDAHTLDARVTGEAGTAVVESELKGVTYHDLRVEQTRDGWRARVIFDV
jgi:SHS2 domain-containing protein